MFRIHQSALEGAQRAYLRPNRRYLEVQNVHFMCLCEVQSAYALTMPNLKSAWRNYSLSQLLNAAT